MCAVGARPRAVTEHWSAGRFNAEGVEGRQETSIARRPPNDGGRGKPDRIDPVSMVLIDVVFWNPPRRGRFLDAQGLYVPGLFRVAGDTEKIRELKARFDSGEHVEFDEKVEWNGGACDLARD